MSDMRPLAQRFRDVGASDEMSRFWFASVLRDGFALAAAGASAPFSAVAEGALRVTLAAVPVPPPSLDAAVTHVMEGSRPWRCTRMSPRAFARCATRATAS